MLKLSTQDLEEDRVKHMVRQPTYFYLLLLRPLTNFSINLFMERIHDPLSSFLMEHSIIAMGLWFFVQSLPVCFVRLRTRVVVMIQTTGPNDKRSNASKTYW